MKENEILLGCYAFFKDIVDSLLRKNNSKEKINISVKFPTISVGSSAKFNKMQFTIIALAPVILLGCILILLIVFTPKNYTFLWTILLILNFAVSGGDYMQFFKIRKYPTNTYFQDNSNETVIYQEQ